MNVLFQACSFGYHAGGWGKPPVDENGKPLYGDVFGTKSSEFEVRQPFSRKLILNINYCIFIFILNCLLYDYC